MMKWTACCPYLQEYFLRCFRICAAAAGFELDHCRLAARIKQLATDSF